MEVLRSRSNQRYKEVLKLLRKKGREESGKYIEEGSKQLEVGDEVEYLILREGLEVEERYKKYNYYMLSEELFKTLSSQENSQGLLIIRKKPDEISYEELGDTVVLLDKVQDPGNVGTIIRTLDALDIKDLLLVKGSVDVYNSKCVRSAMGSLNRIKVKYVEEEELIREGKKRGYKFIGTLLDSDSISYTNVQLEQKNIIIFGNEGNGIGENLKKELDEKVIIPIYGRAESLNVSLAAGIMMYKIKEKLLSR